MNLKQASNYFNRTALLGWTGTAWKDTKVKGTLLPSDRFISDREFGLKRRYLLVNPDTPIPTTYTSLKLDGVIYLIGAMQKDIRGTAYSLIYLVHAADKLADLLRPTKTITASGVPGSMTYSSQGVFVCDIQRITFERGPEIEGAQFTQNQVVLPSDCGVTVADELAINGELHQIGEVYLASGLLTCKTISKPT